LHIRKHYTKSLNADINETDRKLHLTVISDENFDEYLKPESKRSEGETNSAVSLFS